MKWFLTFGALALLFTPSFAEAGEIVPKPICFVVIILRRIRLMAGLSLIYIKNPMAQSRGINPILG